MSKVHSAVIRVRTMTARNGRILICCAGFPPGISGTNVLVGQLFRHLPAEELVALGREVRPGAGDPLPIERHSVSFPGPALWRRMCLEWVPEIAACTVRRRLELLARQYPIRRIYAHFPDASFLLGGWQAAVRLQLPLTVFFDILWEEAFSGVRRAPWRRHGVVARRYEHSILTRADSRFALTESAAEYLQQKHGVPVHLMPHTLDPKEVPEGFVHHDPDAPVIVHFAGSVYRAMNSDSLARLAAALPLCRTAPRLDLCTPNLPPELVRMGCESRYLSRSELRLAQRDSTILYIPQAFDGGAQMMIRHNMPTKVIEYLESGRPILVHSPEDSYLSRLAQREGFAVVVDRPDVRALADAVDTLATDVNLQTRLVENAQRFARSRDSRIWAARLWDALSN